MPHRPLLVGPVLGCLMLLSEGFVWATPVVLNNPVSHACEDSLLGPCNTDPSGYRALVGFLHFTASLSASEGTRVCFDIRSLAGCRIKTLAFFYDGTGTGSWADHGPMTVHGSSPVGCNPVCAGTCSTCTGPLYVSQGVQAGVDQEVDLTVAANALQLAVNNGNSCFCLCLGYIDPGTSYEVHLTNMRLNVDIDCGSPTPLETLTPTPVTTPTFTGTPEPSQTSTATAGPSLTPTVTSEPSWTPSPTPTATFVPECVGLALAGYWNTSLQHSDDGPWLLVALPDPRFPGVAVQVKVFVNGVQTGLNLKDNGQGGDFFPGDGFWGVVLELQGPLTPGRFLLELGALNAVNQPCALWPYFTVE